MGLQAQSLQSIRNALSFWGFQLIRKMYISRRTYNIIQEWFEGKSSRAWQRRW
jgi:hypothetical protein